MLRHVTFLLFLRFNTQKQKQVIYPSANYLQVAQHLLTCLLSRDVIINKIITVLSIITEYLKPKKMRQIKLVLGIEGLDPSGIEVFAGTIETSLTGNAALPNSASYVPMLSAAKLALHNAIHATHPDPLTIKGAQQYMVKVLHLVMASVELECDNDEVKAASSGFSIKQPGLPKAKVFNANQGSLSGTVDLQSPYAGPHAAYVWEMVADPINANTWQQIKITNNTGCTMSGLTPGNKYWFRVKAIVQDTEQPYTDPHMVHVV